jgi:pimeloyl-ACP methyl ester carboxylesterase
MFGNLCNLWRRVGPVTMQSDATRKIVAQVLDDGAANWGKGASLDCKEGLTPLRARPKTDTSSELSAITAYKRIDVPVALWYGNQDPTVPVFTAEWLNELIPGSDLQLCDGSHSLYFHYTEAILDDLIEKMNE